MAGELATKPASEATFREQVAAMVLQGTVVNDGTISLETHAQYATQAADALIARLEGAA